MVKRTFSRRRRFSKPLAHKKLIWAVATGSFTETAGNASGFIPLLASEWIMNTSTGHVERAKILKAQFVINATPLATSETRVLMVCHDDVAQANLNPFVPANWSQTDCVHLGQLFVPSNAAATGPVPLFNGYPDGVRNIKVNRLTRNDRALFVFISPAAAAGNQLTITWLARVLVQLD